MKELVDNIKKDALRQLLLFQLQGSQNRRAKKSSTQGLLQIQISGPDLGQITFGEPGGTRTHDTKLKRLVL